jgi:site-specific DNA-methyltransferase (adenine-specific)
MELNKIYNESNLETMAKMPDNFIDLTVTSPPYDDLRDYKGYSFPFEEIAKELYRITKEGGIVVWIVGDATVDGSETGTSFKQALYFMECGFNLHDTMIYERVSPFPMNNRYHPSFEYMFVFSKGVPKTFNRLMEKRKAKTGGSTFRNKKGELNGATKNAKQRMKKANEGDETSRKNIWKYAVGGVNSSKDSIAFEHPAIFPEKLCSEHIYSWSNENDLVYDCFMGSGTTAKMAHIYKRRWIGSELSKEYTELANKRLKPYLEQTSLF